MRKEVRGRQGSLRRSRSIEDTKLVGNLIGRRSHLRVFQSLLAIDIIQLEIAFLLSTTGELVGSGCNFG
jgi:hypothetical protein